MSEMSMRRFWYLPALLIVAAVGCVETRTVTREELQQAAEEWHEPKVSAWYYMGSKGGYHYFYHEDVPEHLRYRVPESEFKIEERFPYSSKQARWRFMRWGVHGRFLEDGQE